MRGSVRRCSRFGSQINCEKPHRWSILPHDQHLFTSFSFLNQFFELRLCLLNCVFHRIVS